MEQILWWLLGIGKFDERKEENEYEIRQDEGQGPEDMRLPSVADVILMPPTKSLEAR